jgi:glutathione S-transferase
MKSQLTLVSHALCPYVQRAAIMLIENGVQFERRDVDLKNKPEWFLALSPLGKTPVLQVGSDVIFESAVICEYIDETHEPRLHPTPAIERARHRSWMEFGSAVLNGIGALGTHVAKLDPAEMAANRNGGSTDPKAAAAVRFAVVVTRARGHVSNADLDAVQLAGYTEGEIIEIVLHVALNTLTNYVNEVAMTDIDFPVVSTSLAA